MQFIKKAMTVSGPVLADELGHILPHEHILSEIPNFGFQPLYSELMGERVRMDLLGKIRRDIWSCADNIRLDEPEVSLQEVASFKMRGGGTIVDVTTIGLKRNVRAVAEIAQKTGVHIVVGTGVYIQAGHPEWIASQSVDELARWMTGEVLEGIDDTGIRAGIIGEIGISTLTPDEEKALRAALQAHHATGAPVSIHQHDGAELERIDAVVREEGVDPARVVLCHMSSVSAEQRCWAAERGYYIEFDCFGNEYYLDAMAGTILQDPARIKMVKELIERGHLRQILVSCDTALKIMQKKYGGWGYEHLLVNIKPFMLRLGIPPKSIDTLLYYNPARMIAYLD